MTDYTPYPDETFAFRTTARLYSSFAVPNPATHERYGIAGDAHVDDHRAAGWQPTVARRPERPEF
ncbi:MAG: hypothetical protein ACXWIP_01325 [Burkholderiales bacterium]